MATKKKKPKEDYNALEKKIRDAAPAGSLVFPVTLINVYNEYERLWAVIGKLRNGTIGLLYCSDSNGETIEIATYHALNPHHMVFNPSGMSDSYKLYS